MKKLLGIIVLGLLLSGNAYAEIIKFKCIRDNTPKNTTYTKIEYTLDTEKKTIYSNYVWFVKKKIYI